MSEKKKSFTGKIVKTVLFVFLFLFILLVCTSVFLYFYFTPARVEKLVEKRVSETVGRPFEFQAVHFNIFNGFIFKNVSLAEAARDDSSALGFPIRSFYAPRIVLKYSLRRIFKREIALVSAIIDSPNVSLFLQPVPLDSTQTMKDAETDTTIMETATTSPVSVYLETFQLRNAEIQVETRDSSAAQYLYISNVGFSLDHVSIPQGDLLNPQSPPKGHFSFECRPTTFKLVQNTAEQSLAVSGELDALINLDLFSLEKISTRGHIEAKSLQMEFPEEMDMGLAPVSFPIRLDFAGIANAIAGEARLDSCVLRVDQRPWVTVFLQADSLLSLPTVQAKIIQSHIPVAQLLNLAGTLIPDIQIPPLYLHNSDAYITFTDSEIFGHLPDTTASHNLHGRALCSMENFGITLEEGDYILTNLNFDVKAQFDIGLEGPSSPEAHFAITYDSLIASLSEEQLVYSGPTNVKMDVWADENLMPARVVGEIGVKNLLGARLDGSLNMRSSSGLAGLHGEAHVTLDKFDIAQFTEGEILSTIGAQLDVNLNSLDEILFALVVETDSLKIQQEFEKIAFAPLSNRTAIAIKTDTSFSNISIDSISSTVNDFAKAEANGVIRLLPSIQASLVVPDVSVDHQRLLDWVPEQLKQSLVGLVITGSSHLNAKASFEMTPQDTLYSLTAGIKTRDTDLDYYYQFVSLGNIVLDGKMDLDSRENLSANFLFAVDSIKTSNLPQSVFYENQIKLHATMSNFQTLTIDTGFVSLPDLKTQGRFSAHVDRLDENPIINANVVLDQTADDTIRISNDIYYTGQNYFNIGIRSDSVTAIIDAQIKTSDLTVNLPNQTRIERMNSNVHLNQALNIVENKLYGSPQTIVQTPSKGVVDYLLYKDYYRDVHESKSYIDIRRVNAASYVIENIHADAFLGEGRFEFPFFTMDIYGGNIGGSFALQTDVDNLLNSEYRLSAHLSGINSSLLLPAQRSQVKSLVSAHTELRGKGLDFENGVDLNGFFHITKLESKVADNLLRSLDPEGKDSGIRSTRILINRGFKPRLFSFEIRHGYLYPSVFFDQPWYFPVRLSGGGIELSRIPIAYFVTNQ